jgi:hypothetical protein
LTIQPTLDTGGGHRPAMPDVQRVRSPIECGLQAVEGLLGVGVAVEIGRQVAGVGHHRSAARSAGRC